jgi:hypothetical protein
VKEESEAPPGLYKLLSFTDIILVGFAEFLGENCKNKLRER